MKKTTSSIRRPRRLLILGLVVLLLGLINYKVYQYINRLPKIHAEGTELVTSSGKVFKMWGLNFINTDGRLTEDGWDTPEYWKQLDKHYQNMQDLGANTIRVHLQYNKFMDGPTKPNQAALNKLGRLVGLAEKHKLYLIITGLGEYHKQDNPVWYDAMDEHDRWATQAVFWQNVAKKIGGSTAVLAYDLMNEPVVARNPNDGWLPGNSFGGQYFVQNITRDAAGRSTDQVLRQWINTQKTAIREVDSHTMVTVGFIGFAGITANAPDVDFVSAHVYPKTGEVDKATALIQNLQTNKPLAITETYPLAIDAAGLKQFIQANNPYVVGWVGQYLGRTLAEVTPPKTIPDALQKDWLIMFKSLSPTQK